jgi:hypothetical protein
MSSILLNVCSSSDHIGLDARLQTAGYLLMGKPSDDKLAVQKKELMVKHTYQ